MTGKQQKAKAVKEDMLERVKLTREENEKAIDEAVAEIHAQNSEFLENFKMPIRAFRGMYLTHTLFGMVDDLVLQKQKEIMSKKIDQYLQDEKVAKRKGK